MKKKFFDKSLIVEGLSQLKLPGLIFLVLSVLGSGLPAIFRWVNYHNVCTEYGPGSAYAWSSKVVYITNVTEFLLPVVYIAPFVFCLVLFSFLNKRKGSDFYHSLSNTRISLFVNFAASILIWLAIIVVSTVLTASTIYLVSGMIFNLLFIPYLIFTFFSAAMLVTACMLFAMSITGTVLTNIIMTGIIMFLPRFIMTLAFQSLVSAYSIVSSNANGILNVQYNIPVCLIFSYFLRNMNVKIELYTSVSAIIYTLILAVIYLAIACLLFHHRKSELAGSGAPNRILQHIFRCIVTLPVALMIPIFIVYNQRYNSGYSRNDLSVYITIAVISILIYFLYELVTTKSAKKMLRSAPVLLVVVAVCGLFGVSLNIAKNNILNFSPSGSEIDHASIVPFDYNEVHKDTTYSSLMKKDVQFKDPSTLNNISSILSANIDKIKSGYYPNYGGETKMYRVGITLKNGKYSERMLYANSTQSSALLESMSANNDYLDSKTKLSNEKSRVNVSNIANQTSNQKLWDLYQSEYANLSESEKEYICYYTDRYYTPDYKETYTEIATITVYGNIGVYNYGQDYPITLLTPKTAAMYAEILNEQNKATVKDFMAKFKTMNKNAYTSIGVTLYGNSELSKTPSLELASFNLSDQQINSDNVAKCFDILKSQMNDQVDLSKPYAAVYLGIENHHYSFYQALSKDNAKAIQALKLISKY